MSGILERIIASVRTHLERIPPLADLEVRSRAVAAERLGERRSLAVSLRQPGVRVIAECKRRSPSAGVLRNDLDPPALAAAYEGGGAAAISVVTEPEFFGGDPAWLGSVRAAVGLPILRKDFLIDERQLFESVLLGADAVLLIAAVLEDGQLGALSRLAAELGLEVLLEVHDGAELGRALSVPVPVIGVNARDLRSFAVDLEAAAALAAAVPADRIAVLESGISDRSAVARMTERGLNRFLIGEHLVRAADPRAALRALLAAGGEA